MLVKPTAATMCAWFVSCTGMMMLDSLTCSCWCCCPLSCMMSIWWNRGLCKTLLRRLSFSSAGSSPLFFSLCCRRSTASKARCVSIHTHTYTHKCNDMDTFNDISSIVHRRACNKLHLICIQMMNSDWMTHTMAKNVLRFHTYPSFSTIWVLNYHHFLSDICKNRSKLTSMSIKLLNMNKIQINKNKQICNFLILKWDLHGLQNLNH